MGLIWTNWRRRRKALEKAAKYADQLATKFRAGKLRVSKLERHIEFLEKAKKEKITEKVKKIFTRKKKEKPRRGSLKELYTAMDNFSLINSELASFFLHFKNTIKNLEDTKAKLKDLGEDLKKLKREGKLKSKEYRLKRVQGAKHVDVKITASGIKLILEKIREHTGKLRNERRDLKEYRKAFKIQDKRFIRASKEFRKTIKEYRKQLAWLRKDPALRHYLDKLRIHDPEIEVKLGKLQKHLRKYRWA